MKYEIKEQQDDIFIIRENPNKLLDFFGLSKCFEKKYKICGNYKNFEGKAIMREDGEMLPFHNPITKLINNHLRKF